MKTKEEEPKIKEKATPTEKKSVLTTFILLFPSMLIAALTTFETSIWTSGLAIALFFYQAILLKNFVDDHYTLG